MNILVLCTGNSARSILLESLLNSLGATRIKAWSAGSHPAGQVHPGAIELLQREGFATDALRSKSWDEFALPDAPQMDVVITVCGNAASETCPIWPGAPLRAHWGVEDPAAVDEGAAQDQAFATAFHILQKRAKALVAAQIETLDPTEQASVLARIAKLD